MKPAIPITDKRFVYTSAACSDIRKRFDRIRREMAAAASPHKVTPIRKETK